MNKSSLDSYLSHGHRSVDGWLMHGAAQSAVTLAKEQRKLNLTGGVAEIGVHHGRFFIPLYLLCSDNEPAVAVDLFSHQDLNVEGSGCGSLECLKKNLRKHADLSRLVVHEGDSTQLSSEDLLRLGGGPMRIISIDGGHTPEITAHDLWSAEGALCDGGVVILDDCFNESWPGVVEGVFHYFSTPRSIVPFAIGAGKAFFTHQHCANRYAAALKAISVKSSEHSFLGHRVACLIFTPLTLAERIGKLEAWKKLKDVGPAPALRNVYHAVRKRSTS